MTIAAWDEATLLRFMARELENRPGVVTVKGVRGLADQIKAITDASANGVAEANFNGVLPFTAVTIAHGMASAPQTVQLTSTQETGGTATVANLMSVDAADIDVAVFTLDGSVPGASDTCDVHWTAFA